MNVTHILNMVLAVCGIITTVAAGVTLDGVISPWTPPETILGVLISAAGRESLEGTVSKENTPLETSTANIPKSKPLVSGGGAIPSQSSGKPIEPPSKSLFIQQPVYAKLLPTKYIAPPMKVPYYNNLQKMPMFYGNTPSYYPTYPMNKAFMYPGALYGGKKKMGINPMTNMFMTGSNTLLGNVHAR
jgi:hypothetical protein